MPDDASKTPAVIGMTTMSRATIHKVLISVGLVVAGGAALGFGVTHYRQDLFGKSESLSNSTTAPSSASTEPAAQGKGVDHAAPIVSVRINANNANSADTPPASSGATTPVFDVARIDPNGDAVIAGNAAPGARVELLRNGIVEDHAVADRLGQFVMTPVRLPAGEYALTLRSIQTDGKQALSQQSVSVALQPPPPIQRTAVAMLNPDKSAEDGVVSYRSLPPLSSLGSESGSSTSGHRTHRHLGHKIHYYVYRERRHPTSFASHHAAFARAAQNLNYSFCTELAERRSSGFSSGYAEDPQAQRRSFVSQCMMGRVPFGSDSFSAGPGSFWDWGRW